MITWSTAADLPQPMYTVHQQQSVEPDQFCMVGGVESGCFVKSAYTCSVSALLQSWFRGHCMHNFTEHLWNKAGVWRQFSCWFASYTVHLWVLLRSTTGNWWLDEIKQSHHSCLHVQLHYQLLGNHQSHDNWSTPLFHSCPPWQPADGSGRCHWVRFHQVSRVSYCVWWLEH